MEQWDDNTGPVTSVGYVRDHPYYVAKVVVLCPDGLKICADIAVEKKEELPKRGEEVPLLKSQWGYQVAHDWEKLNH